MFTYDKWYINTLRPEINKIFNKNFQNVQDYFNVIYDASLAGPGGVGTLRVPLSTTGVVKATTGDFINLNVRSNSIIYGDLTVVGNIYGNSAGTEVYAYNIINDPSDIGFFAEKQDTSAGQLFYFKSMRAIDGISITDVSSTVLFAVDVSRFKTILEGQYIENSSLGSQFYYDASSLLNVSTGSIDASFIDVYSRLDILDSSIAYNDASIVKLFAKLASTDSSIANINSSLGTLNNWNVSQDASIVDIRATLVNSGKGAGNGLQILADGSYGLGGLLSEITSIDTSSHNLLIGSAIPGPGPLTSLLSITPISIENAVGTFDGNVANLISIDQGGTTITTNNNNGQEIGTFDVQTNSIVMTVDTQAIDGKIASVTLDSGQALTYAADYTSKFVDRSLIDLGYLKAYVAANASIGALNASVGRLDGSVNKLFTLLSGTDASIVRIDGSLGRIDASVNKIFSIIANVSIGGLDASVGRLDGSVNKLFTTTSNLNSSLGLFVLKSGDTMTGGLTISSGGLNVTNDVSLGGSLYVTNNVAIQGNLTVNGSVNYVNVATLNVSTNFISVNSGLTGVPPDTLQSGLKIGRGSEDPYVFYFDEHLDTFRIGIAPETSIGFNDASTQAVATRQDNPLNRGLAWWDPSVYMFKTAILQAGSGVTITQTDTSILIAVTGASAYAKKYTTTFDGTAYDSSTITAATHGCGTGPFNVAVYDNNVLVYPDVQKNGSGDVTIAWSTGSMSASGSLIITG